MFYPHCEIMDVLRKPQSEDSLQKTMILLTWENFLGMLDLVEVFPFTSLNFQTTEESNMEI